MQKGVFCVNDALRRPLCYAMHQRMLMLENMQVQVWCSGCPLAEIYWLVAPSVVM